METWEDPSVGSSKQNIMGSNIYRPPPLNHKQFEDSLLELVLLVHCFVERCVSGVFPQPIYHNSQIANTNLSRIPPKKINFKKNDQ